MATQQTITRAYWMTAKALSQGDNTVLSAKVLLRRVLEGMSEERSVFWIERYEVKYGPFDPVADPMNSALLPARAEIASLFPDAAPYHCDQCGEFFRSQELHELSHQEAS